MEYYFITYLQALKIHHELIETFGGPDGIRDENLQRSALSQASASFQGEYLHKNIYEMGAAYLFHVVRNHPFIDGNKRTGLMLALIFFSLHGIEIDCDEDLLYEKVILVAEGKMKKEELASWFEDLVASPVV